MAAAGVADETSMGDLCGGVAGPFMRAAWIISGADGQHRADDALKLVTGHVGSLRRVEQQAQAPRAGRQRAAQQCADACPLFGTGQGNQFGRSAQRIAQHDAQARTRQCPRQQVGAQGRVEQP